MKRALFVMSTLAGSTGVSQAGGYLGVGIGPTTAITEDAQPYSTPQGRSGRVLAGLRFGNLAVEGGLSGVGTATPHGDELLLTAWAAGKLSIPLGSGFEVFGRVGGHHTTTEIGNVEPFEISGNGLLAGAGFEYSLNLIATKASLFVDYTLAEATLTGDNNAELDVTLRTWTLGITFGL